MLRASSLRLVGAALILVAAAPAIAATAGDTPPKTEAAPSDQSSDTAAAPAEAAKPKPEERKICHMVDSSESRLGAKKVCMTAAQWKNAQF